MKQLNRFIKEYKHFFLLTYYLVILLLFAFVNQQILPEDIKFLMYLPSIDDLIPFNKYMVVPYVLWYPYIILPLIYFGFKDKRTYYKLCFFLFSGMTISYILYFIFPNGIGLHFRPEIVDQDIFSRIIHYLYSVDNPTNSCPSIHVIDTLAVHSAIINSSVFKSNRLVKRFSLVLSLFICASTVMIKQHSIIDVIASLALCSVIYVILFTRAPKKSLARQFE